MAIDLKNGKDQQLIPDIVRRARNRDVFLNENNPGIVDILKSDLAGYIDNTDVQQMRMVTLDFFIPAFLQKICNVYNKQPILKYAVKNKDQERLDALLSEVGFFQYLEDSFLAMRFHNTVLSYVRYLDSMDKVYISTLNAGNSTVFENESYSLIPNVVFYRAGDYFYIWDRVEKLHFYTKKEPTKDNYYKIDRYPIFGNTDLNAPDYWPFAISRYKDHGTFWGNGMDSLVELIRSFNILLSVTNDDSIKETIRILILRFMPAGIIGENGQLKTGMRHPLFPEGSIINTDVGGEILSADLYTTDILNLINSITEIISTLHGIDSVLKSEIKSNLSGIAIRLKSEPLMRTWRKQINIARARDMELIKTLIDVHNYHRDKSLYISPHILDGLVIDYAEPTAMIDEVAEYDFERKKWEDGTGNPVEWMMKRNPELDESQAMDKIRVNLKITNDVQGLANINITPIVDNINQAQ